MHILGSRYGACMGTWCLFLSRGDRRVITAFFPRLGDTPFGCCENSVLWCFEPFHVLLLLYLTATLLSSPLGMSDAPLPCLPFPSIYSSLCTLYECKQKEKKADAWPFVAEPKITEQKVKEKGHHRNPILSLRQDMRVRTSLISI